MVNSRANLPFDSRLPNPADHIGSRRSSRTIVRGSMNYQVNKVAMESGIFAPGNSRHEAKNTVRGFIGEAGGCATGHDIASQTGIYSFGTFEKYKDVWHGFGHFCKSELNVKDILKVRQEHVHEFLEYRAVVDQIGWRTFQLECSALNKLDDTLTRFCEKQDNGLPKYDFAKIIAEAKQEFKDVLQGRQDGLKNRAYDHPNMIAASIESDDHRLSWQLAVEGGGRISEISIVREKQLLGLERDPHTGRQVGVVQVQGKGGLDRPLFIAPETYRKLAQAVAAKGGLFQVKQNALRASVRQAAGDEYNGRGVHGGRYNFAQNRYVELTRHGYSHEQTISLVSRELGHHRADITLHYLCL